MLNSQVISQIPRIETFFFKINSGFQNRVILSIPAVGCTVLISCALCWDDKVGNSCLISYRGGQIDGRGGGREAVQQLRFAGLHLVPGAL